MTARRRLALAAATLGLLGAAGTAAVALSLRRPGPAPAEPVIVSVGEGERFIDVARGLQRQGLLPHAFPLVLWARLTGRDRAVRWGEYVISEPLSPLALLDRLTGPPDPINHVTVPEGLTVHEVVRLLADAGYGPEEGFLRVVQDPGFLASENLPPVGAEGYLFPDTYVLPRTMSPERILRTMVRRFREVFNASLIERATALGLTEHRAVTLASLIEEETAVPDEHRLVAAVFLNRLQRGMRLQSDPTVLYGRESDERTLTRADLRRPTPYNTYTSPGLPPSPIANPGRAALEAAVDPAPADYLYFVARGDGSHEFTTSLAAHNRAVARYRRAIREGISGR